ncbi:MAG: hypothetical protein IJT98_03315 [Prevotella sp.]|nr:hypothetical protein [Prevotella sp.]
MCIAEESKTGYEDPRWVEKSNSIKTRDNDTCQLCHAINPTIEGGLFVQQGDYETLHQYFTDDSIYQIHVIEYGFPINFKFSYGFHLAMPRLNVHHKLYYRNRKLWDYQDDCLVTLCEHCHHYLHSLQSIPVVEELMNGQTILVEEVQPKPYQVDHTDLGAFRPFALVKENTWGVGLSGQSLEDFRRAKSENKKWYDYYNVLDDNVVKVECMFVGDSRFNNNHTKEEARVVSSFIVKDFLENFMRMRIVKKDEL